MKAGRLELKLVEDHVAAIERQGVAAMKKAIAALTARLERSISKKGKSPEERDEELFWRSFGGWQGDGTADEQIERIRKARNFTRTREKL
ncbi:MAG: hypothetical protein KF797_03450 [Flavobacteriales bacterium]|nr:hypothetical protein [Flavobacteriales bacterium]